MSVDFKFGTMKPKVSDHSKPTENSVFQFSVSDFHSEKPILTNHV